ncbi:tripartite tricarboxylate transporter permease [Intestinimonas butyriciproducens]|uniref:tripartite tricarboxylate transporter permease n=1 Tax=Intestinimonas butyriciproducens TaxID=1297617 RepID=UPI0009DD3428|nr:tripartite tricarboxylate transporter permease [Intestinimonas butyriciproducens]
MDILQNLAAGIAHLASPEVWIFIILGVAVGIVFGAIPGLTATTALAMFTPLTFALPRYPAFGFLLGIYCGGYYAGSIPAILLKTPGAPGNAATCVDGYPMREQGLAGKALSLSVTSSMIGGIFSALILLFFAPLIGKMGYLFGAPEYFAIAMMGMTCLAGVSGKDLCKGIASGLLGLCMAMIGQDAITGMTRFTFGSVQMISGISLIPGLIGLFAVTEVLSKAEEIGREKKGTITDFKFYPPKLADYIHIKWILFKSCLIGTVIGAIPGTGPTISAWMAYNEAKRSSKHPELYGKGSPEGVIACEASNNAVTGGAMIPLTTLGIPGDSVTAILLGALMIHGMTPGVTFVTNYADMLYFFFIVLIIANLFMWAFGLLGSKLFPYILSVPTQILMPFVIVMCICGVYAAASTYYNLFLIVILGAVGFLLIKAGFSMAPMVLGFVLGNIIENNFQRALIGSNMDPLCFFSSPLSIGIWVAAIVLTTWMLVKNKQSNAMDAKLNSAKGADTSAEKD